MKPNTKLSVAIIGYSIPSLNRFYCGYFLRVLDVEDKLRELMRAGGWQIGSTL